MRRFFAGIGSAGGHRAMAKAVVPMDAFRRKFGDLAADDVAPKLHELMGQFLHEAPQRDKDARNHKVEGKGETEELKTR